MDDGPLYGREASLTESEVLGEFGYGGDLLDPHVNSNEDRRRGKVVLREERGISGRNRRGTHLVVGLLQNLRYYEGVIIAESSTLSI